MKTTTIDHALLKGTFYQIPVSIHGFNYIEPVYPNPPRHH